MKINVEFDIELNLKCASCQSKLELTMSNPITSINDELNVRLDDLSYPYPSLSVRTMNILNHEKIFTVLDVLRVPKCILRKLPNFGRKSMEELEDKMNFLGFSMTEGDDSDGRECAHYPIRNMQGEIVKD